MEGLKVADYVTLYDHPDKYWLYKNKGNPFNFKKLQKTRIFITQSVHWRETNSTTMTFACTVKTLQEDYHVWRKFCRHKTPRDFHAFVTITQNNFFDTIYFFLRGRKGIREFIILLKNILTFKHTKKLISSIPAYSTHIENAFLSPLIDWEKTLRDSLKGK
ncbi:MAG: hypothetical protein LBD20_04955 [Spirochaetaceae bacterium]|nr:hypothetical protein [Spirochaetaceae bacterium]